MVMPGDVPGVCFNHGLGTPGQEEFMKLRFDAEVRRTLASELRKASWLMGGLIAAAGFVTNRLYALFCTMVAWFALQLLALLLLALRDDEVEKDGE